MELEDSEDTDEADNSGDTDEMHVPELCHNEADMQKSKSKFCTVLCVGLAIATVGSIAFVLANMFLSENSPGAEGTSEL